MSTAFDEWAVVELLGHRKVVGRVTEQQIAGAGFLRVDIPGEGQDFTTQFYGPASIYCITPTTEEIARSRTVAYRPLPIAPWGGTTRRYQNRPQDWDSQEEEYIGDEKDDDDDST